MRNMRSSPSPISEHGAAVAATGTAAAAAAGAAAAATICAATETAASAPNTERSPPSLRLVRCVVRSRGLRAGEPHGAAAGPASLPLRPFGQAGCNSAQQAVAMVIVAVAAGAVSHRAGVEHFA